MPGGYAAFSMTDDKGDERLLPMIRGWVETDAPHDSGNWAGRLRVIAVGPGLLVSGHAWAETALIFPSCP
jgi:hypothetical protein